MLLSGNIQFEHIAAGKVLKQRYYRKFKILYFCKPVLLSGNVKSEHVPEGEMFHTRILSEH